MKNIIYSFLIIIYFFMSSLSYSIIYNNKKIVTQTFITYEKESGEKISAVSNYVSINLREIVAFEIDNYLPEQELEYDKEVILPYKLINRGNFSEGYIIEVKNYKIFSEFSIFIDLNNNGILDENEKNEIEKIGNGLFETPKINTNESINFILKGKLKNKLEVNKFKVLLKITSLSQREIFKNIENNISIYSKRNITVRKGVIFDKENGQYYFTFKYLNESSTEVEEIYLEDNINPNFKFNSYIGYWQNFESLKKEEVTFFKDGYEKKFPRLDVSLINNKLRVLLKKVPIQNKNDVGGVLYIPFYIDKSISQDEKLKNIAEYTYILNGKKSKKYKTNEILIFNRYIPKLEVSGDNSPLEKEEGEKYIFRFENQVKNLGNGSDTYNILVKNSNFPKNIKFLNLTDSNNDGIVDTGFLEPGEIKKIIFEIAITKEELENKNYSLNLLFNSVKVKDYIVSNTNSLSLEIKEKDVEFVKEQRLRNGSYTKENLKVSTGQKIFYKIRLRNKNKTKTVRLDKIYDIIPEKTILSEGDGSLGEGGKPVYKKGDSLFKEIEVNRDKKKIELKDIELKPFEEIVIYFNVDVS